MYNLLIRCARSLAALAVLAVMSGTAQAKNEKITICHVPPGNPDNAHTITISENAWPAHQAHGDSQGECPDPPPGEDGDDDSDAGDGNDDDNDGGGDDGEDTGSGGGGSSSGGGAFAVLLCDNRADSKGRRIEVTNVGRVVVQEAECQ